ncbi:hypothetical protein ElyMa_001591600 [Elysia marginata]|uniref:Uncharacterized protein n=1 Tax=Elysia marginata TaxID=1093978 RepID=A0AAV4JFZ5_9GAST|nr:hypothetical protein ElyMa_001591600 [Elysia marginata]
MDRINCFPKATATWHGRVSNPRPPDLESDALTTLPRCPYLLQLLSRTSLENSGFRMTSLDVIGLSEAPVSRVAAIGSRPTLDLGSPKVGLSQVASDRRWRLDQKQHRSVHLTRSAISNTSCPRYATLATHFEPGAGGIFHVNRSVN